MMKVDFSDHDGQKIRYFFQIRLKIAFLIEVGIEVGNFLSGVSIGH